MISEEFLLEKFFSPDALKKLIILNDVKKIQF